MNSKIILLVYLHSLIISANFIYFPQDAKGKYETEYTEIEEKTERYVEIIPTSEIENDYYLPANYQDHEVLKDYIMRANAGKLSPYIFRRK